MLGKYWIHLMIATVIISLISVKGFPLALEHYTCPYFLKLCNYNLISKGLVDDVSAQTFIKSNQSGVIISVICCLAITGILIYTLNDFYSRLTGILGF